MKKIIIFGFSHCGTTILRTIIGHIEEIYEIKKENDVITNNDINIATKLNKKYVLCKSPQAKDIFFNSRYNDYIKIFIIRNPLWVYSSLNRRTSYNISEYHNFKKFEYSSFKFYQYMNNPKKNYYLIKYEDLFINNYQNIRNILNNIGLSYNDNIFDNSLYYDLNELKKNKINDPTNHSNFRQWQIKQEFVNNNNLDKLELTNRQIKQITMNKIINQLYPEIKDLIKHVKIKNN
jgi:hypothetical protein